MTKRLTKEEFVERANAVHNSKYDYSKSGFNNTHEKTVIICPSHGEFMQTPKDHMNGQGCPACGRIKIGEKKRSNAKDFEQKARKIHGDKYDYSQVVYKRALEPVTIICKKHGPFQVTPNAHLSSKQGCPKCLSERMSEFFRYTKEDIIEKGNAAHGGKYDYSHVNYVDSTTKVEIICPIHGSFWQRPSNHIAGHGCPYCTGNKNYTTEEWVEIANKAHHGKYDYSEVNYVNNHTLVNILCTKHGMFQQMPQSHLMGCGCPTCGQDTKIEKMTSNKKEFVEKAIKVHGDKYDYSKVDYVKSNKKVEIICKKHGSFWMTPSNHVMGQNCPQCTQTNIENEIDALLTENEIKYQGQWHYDEMNRRKRNDFYIPSCRIVIECQGGQHFKPIEYFGGEEGFKERLSSDIDKYNFCQRNGITMLYYIKEKDCPDDIFYNPSYQGIYKKENVFFSKEELLKRIRG